MSEVNGENRICETALRRWFLLLAGWLIVSCGIILNAAEPDNANAADAPVDEARLMQLVSSPVCVGVSVDLKGQVLGMGAARHELILRFAGGVLHVRMSRSGLPPLKAGDNVRLSGQGAAGQGVLDEALVDNDGLHGPTEKSGRIFLTPGMHPLRAEWFNGRADLLFEAEYAGPHLPRQPIPDRVLFHKKSETGADAWEPGLNCRCYQGAWEWLPFWRDWLPIESGVVSNFDLSARVQDEDVGLEFTGGLKVDEPGDYTFWTKSDDGSRLFVGDTGLRIEKTSSSPLPAPRNIVPGQTLAANNDCFWAVTEGMVTGVHTDPAGNVRMELSGPQGRTYVEVEAAGARLPALFSRIRAVGSCRAVAKSAGGWIAGRLVVTDPARVTKLTPGIPVETAITSLAELRELAANGQRTASSLCLTGVVMTATTPGGLFAFQDETGGVLVQMDAGAEPLAPGDRIVLRGTGALERNRLFLSRGAVVNNDGLHLRREGEGAMYLRQGRIPLHLSWFNRQNPFALEIYWRGPGVPRQKVPDAALMHPEVGTNGAIQWVPGLNYVAYRGDWRSVARTSQLDPAQIGSVVNFDANAAGPTDKVGLEFNGFLDVPRDGQYYFTIASDDGALLFLNEQVPSIKRLGNTPVPPPVTILPRQVLDSSRNYAWSEVEGTVNYARERDGALVLELSSDYGSMNVEVAENAGCSPLLLIGSRVKVRGFCESGLVTGGQGVAANLIVPGIDEIQVTHVAPAQWNRYPLGSIASALGKRSLPYDEVIVHLRGDATNSSSAGMFELTDGSGTIAVEAVRQLLADSTGPVEVLGRLARSETNMVLRCALIKSTEPDADSDELPVPTKVLQIKQLSREQAERHIPVKVRGVITLVRGTGSGFILQDDTSAIDVWWQPHSNTSLARVGDYWDVEGTTFVQFSPNIRVTHATRLGPGAMPEPLHPAYDQLLNGSLDTRYVEVQGIVTGSTENGITLFTRGGTIHVLLSPVPSEPLDRYRNALVRIRGCVVPIRNETSHQVRVGQTRLSNVSLSVDAPAPDDPFATALKHPSELLLFDARAGSLQRVKIAGQILHAQPRELFLVDGTNSVRVQPQEPADVNAGDRVEVVGFPELGGPSPLLREAILRRTGNAPLPEPRSLAGEAVFSEGRDGELVETEARLVGVSGNRSQKVLELQSGSRDFVARVTDQDGALAKLINGSRLRLTGVYAQERGPVPGQPRASFELLINSPADVAVLARPPWWTLQRVLMFAGLMVVVILAGTLWIVLLHRRVEEAAAKLAVEVRHRERIQQQSVLEKERTRIAKDMHDQLGTNVTQVGLLAELTKKNLGDAHKAALHADQICQRAIELGRTLDEIVWAVNPKNDSLDKFCDYMAVQAQELFQLTDILCRVDLPPEMPGFPLSADVRHNLFLATKEALNNIVRHANAREVWIRFKLEGPIFQMAIVDDGHGFASEKKQSRRNGLNNMSRRMEDIGGRFAINSRPGRGTEVTLTLPVPAPASDGQNVRQTS